MRQSKKMTLFGVIVSLLLLSTTIPVAAGSGSNSNQKQSSTELVIVPKSVDPITKMEQAGEALRKKRARERALRRKRERERREREAALLAQQQAAATTAVPSGTAPTAHLASIAQCESGGDPTAVSSNGMYHGKYQFSVATWQGVGGSGLPSQAPEAEQDMRAQMLYERSGPGQWPVCQGR